jgi:DNA polymerase I-like protein with 3'-5' exonuclease and polymerase domains
MTDESRRDYPLAWLHALARGQAAMALAVVQRAGIPLDVATLIALQAQRVPLSQAALCSAQKRWHFWEPDPKQGGRLIFKRERVEQWIADHRWIWPVFTPTGHPSLKQEILEEIGRIIPEVADFREIRRLTSGLRLGLERIAVQRDGRSHPPVLPVGTITSRNVTKGDFVFGQARWLRHLIVAPPGRALIYCDWSGQEFGVMAALSRDPALLEDYQRPDPYLSMAARFGFCPPDATKATHPALRDRFKLVVLATSYGMGPRTLRAKLQVPLEEALRLLERHHALHPRFWAWSHSVVATARFRREIESPHGWRMRVHPGISDRTLRNWPAQTAAADMMRRALVLLVLHDVQVDAVVHDAFLVECAMPDLDATVVRVSTLMAQASRETLREVLTLKTGIEILPPGARFSGGPAGTPFWNWAMGELGRPEAMVGPTCSHAVLHTRIPTTPAGVSPVCPTP